MDQRVFAGDLILWHGDMYAGDEISQIPQLLPGKCQEDFLQGYA